jgi:hypothetical protein
LGNFTLTESTTDATKGMGGGKHDATLALNHFTVLLGKLLGIRFTEASAVGDYYHSKPLEGIHCLDGGLAGGGCYQYRLDAQLLCPLLGKGKYGLGILTSGFLKIDYFCLQFGSSLSL